MYQKGSKAILIDDNILHLILAEVLTSVLLREQCGTWTRGALCFFAQVRC